MFMAESPYLSWDAFFCRQSATNPLARKGVVTLHHTPRGANDHAMNREVTTNNRICANYAAPAESSSGLDACADSYEAVFADTGRTNYLCLLEHRGFDVLERVVSIGNEYVAGNQTTATDM